MKIMRKHLITLFSGFSIIIFNYSAHAEFGQNDIWNFRERKLEDLVNQATAIEMKKGNMFEKNSNGSNIPHGGISIYGGTVGNITNSNISLHNRNGTISNNPNFNLTQEIEDSNIETELNGSINY
jgi:hypothetical protein